MKTIVSMLSFLIASTSSGAEPEPGVDELEGLLDVKVVSAASRTQERSDDAPATITVVTADDLRRFGLRSLHEAINFFSLGMTAQDPLHSVEVGSRGVLFSSDYGNHMLLLVDGHVMNEQWNGTSYFEQGLGVPIEFIDRIEFIVGPGSVLYGSFAMLGVINVVTKRPRDIGHLQVTAEGSLLPPQGIDGAPQLRWPGFGGTGRISLLTGHETTLAGHAFEFTLAAEYYAHQGQSLTFPTESGLTEGDGERTWAQSWGARAPAGTWGGTTTHSWWTQVPSALLKMRWGDFSLWARGALYARGAPAHNGFGPGADFDGPQAEVDRWANFELRWSKTLSPRLQVMARAYFDLYDYRWRAQSSTWLKLGSGSAVPEGADPAQFEFETGLDGVSRWGGLEVQGTYDWLGDGRFPLMVGVDGRLRHFDAASPYTSEGTVFETTGVYAADEWQLGAYAQQRARLHPRLTLNAGARLDMQSAFEPRVSPRAALVWTAPWEGKVKLVFNTAFRTPSGYERMAEFTAYQIRNPNLRPESVLTFELGYEQRLGRHRLFAGGFVSSFTDMVLFGKTPAEYGTGLFWYDNKGALLNVGGHLLAEGSVGQFSYAATFTAAVNKDGNPDAAELVASPAWFGNARVSWDFGEGLPRASVVSAFSGPRLITAASATSTNADGNEVGWDAAFRTIGPQVELRATLDAQVRAVPGLWLRGVVGGSLTPFSAYTVGARLAPDPSMASSAPIQTPNSRLFVMMTVGWSLDAP